MPTRISVFSPNQKSEKAQTENWHQKKQKTEILFYYGSFFACGTSKNALTSKAYDKHLNEIKLLILVVDLFYLGIPISQYLKKNL